MAGGMRPGRSAGSLGERAASSRIPAAEPGAPPGSAPGSAPDEQPGGAGRHCCVQDPPQAAGRWPGLLVEWRQRDGCWQGRVAYAVPGVHGPALVEAWLPAERLVAR